MKERILILALTLVTVACDNSPKVTTYEAHGTGAVTDTLSFRNLQDYPEIAEENNVDSLISGMIKDDCVYEKAVGFGGTYTSEYACFERLSELLNEKEIFDLTTHPDVNVRLYAYKALVNDESDYLEEAKARLQTDTSEVCTFSGCIRMTMKLKDVVTFEAN